MKARKNLRILLLCLNAAGFGNLQGQEVIVAKPLTLEQAIQITFTNSHVMKQAGFNQQQKSEECLAAKGLYFPKVGIAANYVKMSDDLHLDLTPVRDAITPLYSTLGNYGNFSSVPNPDPNTNQQFPYLSDELSTQIVRQNLLEGLQSVQNGEWDEMIQKKDFGLVSANFIWPVYAGGKIRVANQVAAIHQTEAGEETRQKQGELMTELVQRYFALSLARQAVMVRQEVYEGMNQHLNDAQKMADQGLIAASDVLHAKVFQSQAERELSKAKRTTYILNQALQNTLGQDDASEIMPVSELFYLDSIESEAYFIVKALENNPQLRQVDSKRRLAEQGYKAEMAAYFPNIAFQGMYDIVNKDFSPYAPDWTVGVGLQWTLFDGTSRYRKVKAASMRTSQVDEADQKARADISTLIHKYYQELNMYTEQLKQLETAMTFALEYVSVREKAFHEEMSNSTEVVDARLALAQVRIERLQAMYDYDLSLSHLLEVAGISEMYLSYQTNPNAKSESY